MFSEGLTMLSFDDNGGNNTLESNPNEEYIDSSHDISANKPNTSKKMVQNVVSRVHMAQEEVFEQGHVIDRKISTQQTQN